MWKRILRVLCLAVVSDILHKWNVIGLSIASPGIENCLKTKPETKNVTPFLVIITTIDGKISALNALDGGRLVWSVTTGSGPLLSSSISKMEIKRNGAFIRLVPSLDGQLYQYDGQSIESVPISAESLLSSSFKINDETMVVGGKETQTLGIEASSGKIRYLCAKDGCSYFGGPESSSSDNIIVISQTMKTVRVVESRNGGEKWNFSVGQHDLKYMKGQPPQSKASKAEDVEDDVKVDVCSTDDDALGRDEILEYDMKFSVTIPTGQVEACSREHRNVIWTHKFESPITKVWTLRGDDLQPLNLFNKDNTPALLTSDSQESHLPPEPLLYIGNYNDQVYVQPSVRLDNYRDAYERVDVFPLRVLWRPYLATALSRTPALRGANLPELTYSGQQLTTGDVQLWQDQYPYDSGYFLFADTSPIILDVSNVSLVGDNNDISVTLWNWWKEVAAISIISSILFHILITRYLRHFRAEKTVKSSEECNLELYEEIKRTSESSSEDFESIYEKQFEHIKTLGSGGFGVVFVARKKMDDVQYAVKRIPIHISDDAIDKSLREVRTLAKLDHIGIVAYKNSWIESPPPGWQEEKDKKRETSEGKSSGISMSFTRASTWAYTGQSDPPLTDHCTVDIPSSSTPHAKFYLSNDQQETDESGSYSYGLPGSLESEHHFTDELIDKNRNNDIRPRSNKPIEQSDSFIIFEDSGCSAADKDTADQDCSRSSPSEPRDNTDHNESSASQMPVISQCQRRHFLYIQMQLCQPENLKEWLQANTLNRPRVTVLDIFNQIVSAVAYIHDNGFIHRDLKPSNIFFSVDGIVKVGDFGLVTATMGHHGSNSIVVNLSDFDDCHSFQVGTSLYMSPEQTRGKVYSNKVDIYMLGLILFELLYPFTTEMERLTTLSSLKKGVYSQRFLTEMPTECDVVKWLLSDNPDIRPTAAEIRDHDLLRDYRPKRILGPTIRSPSNVSVDQ